MEEGREKNTDLDVIERAWETSKAYQNSTSVQRYDGALDMDRCQTLYNFSHKETEFIFTDMDTKSSDNLRKFIVIPMQVSRRADEVGGNVEVNLILDSKGHDIGIHYIDEDGPHFILSPKLKESNDKILEKFAGRVDERELNEFKPDSLEDIVELAAKGKHIGLANEKEVIDRLEEKKPGTKEKIEDKEDEEQENEKGIEEVPEELRSEIEEICKKSGMKMSDLKQTLTVTHPGTLIDDIDNNKTNVRENGGNVMALRFRNKEAMGGADEIVLVQDGQVLPSDKRNNETIANLMEQNKGNGDTVHDLRDHREDTFKEDVQDILDFAEEKKEILRNGNTPNLEEELQKVDDAALEEIKDLAASMKPQSKEMEEVVKHVEEKKEEEQQQQPSREMPTDDDYFDELGRRKRMR